MLCGGVLLNVAAAAALPAAPSIADYPQLLDRNWLANLSSGAGAGDAHAESAAAPPMPQDFTCTLLLLQRQGDTNTTLLGDAYVSGSRGSVRMGGLYHVEAPGVDTTVGANIIINSATNTNTVIVNDPVSGDPTCTIERQSKLSAIAAAAPPGIPLGFTYLSTVLTRASLSRTPGKTSFLFVDAFSSAPVAIVDLYDQSDDVQVGLYGNVVPGVVPLHLVSPPEGMECRLAPSHGLATHISAASVELLLGAAIGGTQA